MGTATAAGGIAIATTTTGATGGVSADRSSGYTPRQLLTLSTELIELITLDLQKEREEVKGVA